MNYKLLFIICLLLSNIYSITKYIINWNHRLKPLPSVVSDIYDTERYEKYIAYHKEYIPVYILNKVISLFIDLFIICSPFFNWIEQIAGDNEYVIFLLTFIIIMIIGECISTIFSYYETFHIEEKYGLNHQTKKKFFHDTLMNSVTSTIMLVVVTMFLLFVIKHIEVWTNHYQISYFACLALIIIIAGVYLLLSLLLSLLQLFVLHKQYTFTELEDGPLRNQIIDLMKDSKKKAKSIKVYDESKKSNSKNAFLLKILWHREFGIADNFILENSEDELLAVLSHEIGHLKHKKNIWNYLFYFILIGLLLLLAGIIPSGAKIEQIVLSSINAEFHLKYTNYYIVYLFVSYLLSIVFFPIGILKNYSSRKEEKEADYNAVKEGYGQALITTFKKLSSDEFIDVSPSPIIEFLEYDHPGMYQRITYIQEMMKENRQC